MHLDLSPVHLNFNLSFGTLRPDVSKDKNRAITHNMHYIIDGYNLLFRFLPNSEENLQHQREWIIDDLNQKISLLKLNVSIVFDSAYQEGEGSRSHYKELEIFFTSLGESADEYILDEIKNVADPKQETVITSDKTLALRARNRLAHTQSVEEFVYWLNRSYKNKLRQIKKAKETTSPTHCMKMTSKPPLRQSIPSSNSSLESLSTYYLEIFETQWQEIVKKEEEETLKKKSLDPSKPKKNTKKKSYLSPSTQSEPLHPATEMERWLKIFEQR